MSRRNPVTIAGRAIVAFVAMAIALLGVANDVQGATLTERNLLRSSTPKHSRIEVRLDEPVYVRVADQMAKQKCFFIDLYRTNASFGDKEIPFKDEILKGLRTRYYKDMNLLRIVFYPENDTVFRVVDQATAFEYPVTSAGAGELPANIPYSDHIVIDTPKFRHYGFPELDPGEPSAARGLKHKRLVVIDPGHGGKDPGALSIRPVGGRVLEEKDVVLDISREVVRLLNKTPNLSAMLTRNGDEALGLKPRVDFAEKMDANLFVSIHANSTQYHNSQTAQGPEFFYFSENSNNESQRLVSAENEAGSDLLDSQGNSHAKLVLKGAARDLLAQHRGDGARLCDLLGRVFDRDSYFGKHNRGTKSAPFRVLVNLTSPAILVEVGFVDNAEEAQLLADPAFRKRVAKHIVNGILAYFAQMDTEYDYQFAKK